MEFDIVKFKPLWLTYGAQTTGGTVEAGDQLEAPAKIYVLRRVRRE